MTYSVEFSQKFRQLLSESGDSQNTAAKKLAVSQAYVSRILTQGTVPSVKFLSRLVKMYGLDAAVWFPMCGFAVDHRRLLSEPTMLYDYTTLLLEITLPPQQLTDAFNSWESEGYELFSLTTPTARCFVAVFRRPKIG